MTRMTVCMARMPALCGHVMCGTHVRMSGPGGHKVPIPFTLLGMTTTGLAAEALTMTGPTAGCFDDEWRALLPPLLPAGAGDGGAGDGRARNGAGQVDDWPLRSHLKLGAVAGSVPCARRHARHVTRDWGFGEFSDAIELAVSELAANAVAASAGMGDSPLIRVWLLCDKARFLVLVWDRNPSPPVRREAGWGAESGRGLLLVAALSEQWNWHAPARLGGKVTWCEIAVTDPPEPTSSAV
jgi:hypothetical protein